MNLSQVISILLFSLGIVTESVILLQAHLTTEKRKYLIRMLFISLIVGFLFSVWLTFELDADFYGYFTMSLGWAMFLYTIWFAFEFRKEILVKINELSVLILTILAGCLIYWTHAPGIVWVFYAIPAYIAIVIAIAPVVLTHFLRIFLYCWYLVLLIILGIYGANLKIFLPLFGESPINTEAVWQSFLAGLLFCYLWVNVLYLLNFIPMRMGGKYESRSDVKRRVKEHFLIILEKFSPDQHRVGIQFIVVLFMVGLFLAREHLDWIDISFLTTIVMVSINFIVPLTDKFMSTIRMEDGGEKSNLKSIPRILYSARRVILIPIFALSIIFTGFMFTKPEIIKVEYHKFANWLLFNGSEFDQYYIFEETSENCRKLWQQNQLIELETCGQKLMDVSVSAGEKSVGYFWKGVSYYRQSRYIEAEELLNKAISLNPNNSGPYVTLAAVKYQTGDIVNGCTFAIWAVILDPDYSWAHNAKGLCGLYSGDKSLAIKEFLKAIELEGDVKVFRDNLKEAEDLPI